MEEYKDDEHTLSITLDIDGIPRIHYPKDYRECCELLTALNCAVQGQIAVVHEAKMKMKQSLIIKPVITGLKN